jgi:hypothetical protein
MKNVFGIIFFGVVPGLTLILYSLRLIRGQGNKSFYMADHIYSGRVYAAIPLGIFFLVLAIATIPQSQDISLTIVGIALGFGVLGFIFAFTQPSFLKPPWLKWLEREHRDIMPLLREDAHRMGLNVWNERMQTQADLEDWVAEVRRKYGR